jgi:hypothetical protein
VKRAILLVDRGSLRPEVRIRVSEPRGAYSKLVDVILDRVDAATS